MPDDIPPGDSYGARRQSTEPPQEDPMKTRLSVGLGAGAAAALATAALMAGAGSAQTPASSLHFVSTAQKGAGFMPKGAPRLGDRLGFGDRITGDDTGYDRGVCTIVGRPQILCTIQVQLSKGTLTVQGMLPQRANRTPVAITGGTGAYNGARGTALVTDHGNGRTDVDITLLP
jgi:hypothetical protein